MKKLTNTGPEFEIDKLTNSIENTLSGEVFDTEVSRILLSQAKQIKKSDWVFDQRREFKDQANEIYKLTTINNPLIIQGLICFADKHDHVFMNLIESAKYNKGKHKLYKGVAGNLVAFACKTSFERGYEGVVSFVAKSQLSPFARILFSDACGVKPVSFL